MGALLENPDEQGRLVGFIYQAHRGVQLEAQEGIELFLHEVSVLNVEGDFFMRGANQHGIVENLLIDAKASIAIQRGTEQAGKFERQLRRYASIIGRRGHVQGHTIDRIEIHYGAGFPEGWLTDLVRDLNSAAGGEIIKLVPALY